MLPPHKIMLLGALKKWQRKYKVYWETLIGRNGGGRGSELIFSATVQSFFTLVSKNIVELKIIYLLNYILALLFIFHIVIRRGVGLT